MRGWTSSNACAALLLAAASSPAHHWPWRPPGNLVSVEVLVEGRETPLHPAPDGSGRWYLEARQGARYALRLQNRTARRLAVSLRVDGLNVISGERAHDPSPGSDPGRMYVLEPWGVCEISGWRTSLRDVQRFVFVDERVSYAARTGQANARMGWIELAVYRERYQRWSEGLRVPHDQRSEERDRSAGPRPSAEPDAAAQGRPDAAPPRQEPAPPSTPSPLGSSARSYPGTGWGPRANEPVEVVAFEPEPHPAERLTLRYEYRQALVALGIPLGSPARDRLSERERGEGGFARPPQP